MLRLAASHHLNRRDVGKLKWNKKIEVAILEGKGRVEQELDRLAFKRGYEKQWNRLKKEK